MKSVKERNRKSTNRNWLIRLFKKHARLDEAQAGIKVAGRNINNLRYADDTILLQKAKRNERAS